MPDTLPDGTDHILPGAMNSSATETATESASATRDQFKAGAADFRDKAQAKAEEFRAQASDKARDYAEQGKTRASDALGEVARLLGENANQIDDKIGAQYGDYARRAADYVGGTADALRQKDVEELIEDARELVRKSPALAIGAAATAGFLLARIIKSGSEALEATSAKVAPTPAAEPDIGKAAGKGGKRKSSDS
jgi:ElaB/YqjD/DUF883 family membrane-anchored ribosome-binding protein